MCKLQPWSHTELQTGADLVDLLKHCLQLSSMSATLLSGCSFWLVIKQNVCDCWAEHWHDLCSQVLHPHHDCRGQNKISIWDSLPLMMLEHQTGAAGIPSRAFIDIAAAQGLLEW